jgi:hypothetical protein
MAPLGPEDYVFRKISCNGIVTIKIGSIKDLTNIIKSLWTAIGKPADVVANHSMRSGFCSSMVERRTVQLSAIITQTKSAWQQCSTELPEHKVKKSAFLLVETVNAFFRVQPFLPSLDTSHHPHKGSILIFH